MKHEMKLQPQYYNYILNGTKRIELRLNDEKRKQIKKGDIIIFIKEPDLVEKFECVVTDLLKFNNFEDLFSKYDISLLADKAITKEKLLNDLEMFYTKEKQNEYGVLGIKIDLIK